jgi:hypothetical protein
VGLVRMLVRTLVLVDLVRGVHETVWRERVVVSVLLESYDGERGKSINQSIPHDGCCHCGLN